MSEHGGLPPSPNAHVVAVRRERRIGFLSTQSLDDHSESGDEDENPRAVLAQIVDDRRHKRSTGKSPAKTDDDGSSTSELVTSTSVVSSTSTTVTFASSQVRSLKTEGNADSVLEAVHRFCRVRSTSLPALFGAKRVLRGEDIRSCLWANGIVARESDIEKLIDSLSINEDRTLTLDGLNSAVARHAAGVEDRAERSKQELRLALPAEEEEHEAEPEEFVGLTPLTIEGSWPTEVLSAIQEHIDSEHIRITDIVRSSSYNPWHREEVLDHRSFSQIMEKAGYEISPQNAKHTASFLSPRGDGWVTIDALTAALRANRRGQRWNDVQEWRARSPSPRVGLRSPSPGASSLGRSGGRWFQSGNLGSASPGSPSSTRSGDIPDRVLALHRSHQDKLTKLRIKREMQETLETQRCEERKAAARIGSRASRYSEDSRSPSPNPNDVVRRLLEAGEAREVKIRCMRQRMEERESRELEERRLGPTHLAQRCRAASPPQEVSRRLYEEHRERAAKIGEKQRAELLSQEREFDLVGQKALGRASPTRASQEELSQRLCKKKPTSPSPRVEEKAWRDSPHRPWSEDHAKQMYDYHSHKMEKHEKEAKAWDSAEQFQIRRETEAVLSKTADSRARVGAKYNNVQDATKFHERNRTEETKRDLLNRRKTEVGFNTAVPPHPDPSPMGVHDLGDVVLASINASVSLRCGCSPEDASPKTLPFLLGLVKEVLDLYKRAQRVSDGQPGGAGALREMRSQRLYANGHLMQDMRGQAKMLEPDQIRQIDADVDALLSAAKIAQDALVRAFGPDDTSKASWAPGEKFPKPRIARSALFAFNPGVKTKEAADTKSFVRFAPATREWRFSHVLDYARVGLVFKNSIDLLLAMRDIHSHFEVAQVRNYYCPGLQNHLGERCVEVSVVLTEGLEVPHVCEIRLEEESFFEARMSAGETMNELARGFSEMYHHATDGFVREDAVHYLVRWAFRKPKESQALGRFRRKLAVKFRSNVTAWRRAFRSSLTLDFHDFRTVTMMLQCQRSVVEYWEALECTRSGHISLLELDGEAVMLLARFRTRLVAFFERDNGVADSDLMMAKLAALASVRLKNPGRLAESEFRAVARVFGFFNVDADRLFAHLDSSGGIGPGEIMPSDLDWLVRLPKLIDMESLTLAADARYILQHEKSKVRYDHLEIPRPQFCRRPSFLTPVEFARSGSRSVSPSSVSRSFCLIPALPRSSYATGLPSPTRRQFSPPQREEAITALVTAIEAKSSSSPTVRAEDTLGWLPHKDTPPRERQQQRQAPHEEQRDPDAAVKKKKQRPEEPTVLRKPIVPKLSLTEANLMPEIDPKGTTDAGDSPAARVEPVPLPPPPWPEEEGEKDRSANASAAAATESHREQVVSRVASHEASASEVTRTETTGSTAPATRGIIRSAGASASSKKVQVSADTEVHVVTAIKTEVELVFEERVAESKVRRCELDDLLDEAF